ncbi:MAG: peptidylprolyl isomerase [Bryobacteraceae bacterium]
MSFNEVFDGRAAVRKLKLAPVLLAVPFCLGAAEIGVVEEIVAKVNSEIVTRSELEKSKAAIAAELKQRGVTGPQAEEARKEREANVLRDRIDQLLLIQKGKELGINVDGDVSRQMAELQKVSGIADPEKFQQYVKEQTGMLYEDYKLEMSNQLLTQRVVRQEVGRLINIPRADLLAYYEEHKTEFVRKDQVFLSEIFLSTAGKDDEGEAAIAKKAADLVARARKGEKFGEMASANSDSTTKESYGQLGGFEKDDLKKELIDLVWEQERGFVTDPVKQTDPPGYLILRVDERHRPGQALFEEVENQITERLYMPIFQPKIREYLTALRQDAFLEIKEGYVDAASAPGKVTAWSDPAALRPETVTKEEVALMPHRRRLLWMVPVPGTAKTVKGESSSQ